MTANRMPCQLQTANFFLAAHCLLISVSMANGFRTDYSIFPHLLYLPSSVKTGIITNQYIFEKRE